MVPAYPSNRLCIYIGIYMYHLLCTDNGRNIQAYSITRRSLTDVTTDVHIVPVDSDSPIRNLLKVRTVRCALALYEGN
jgi:hypothetical protein